MRFTMKSTVNTSLPDATTRFRVEIEHAVALIPGKVDVLERITKTGSIAQAGRTLGMSYQRVRSLVAGMNADFVEPLVLTPTGQRLLEIYRLIERDAECAVAKRLPLLVSLIRPEAGAGR